MPVFSINIYEFALLVNRPSGLTVIFPAADHVLSLTLPNGSVAPVARGAEIVLKGPGRATLPAAPTTYANQYAFVPDLSKASGQTVVPSWKLIGGSIDQDAVNGRLILAGGVVTELPCQPPQVWVFPGGTFSLTDSARIDFAVNAGDVYQLVIEGLPVADLQAGTSVTFHNEDALGGPPAPFADLKEFIDLCNLVNVFNVAPPAPAPGQVGILGPNSICFLTQVDSKL